MKKNEGVTHRIRVHEGASSADKVLSGGPLLRRQYRVLEGVTLFKRGREWTEGEVIDLDPINGQAFVDAGELEEVEGADPVEVPLLMDDTIIEGEEK